MNEEKLEIVVPPSPNWYLSGVFECHRKTGLLAYAASRCLVFVWPIERDANAQFPPTRVVPDAHGSKITCVSWYQLSDDDALLLASGGEDGRICVWKANDQTLLMEHDVHEGKKISCLSWLQSGDKKVIASSSEDGNVIVSELLLNYESSSTRKLNIGKCNPTALSFSPHTYWHMAIGCKGGLLYICDIRGNNRDVLHKLRAHEEDIHNVVWCPVASNTLLQKNEKQETYLATSGRDKKIKVWAVAEGKCVAQAKLPGKTGIHRPRPGQYDDKRSSWVALHWLDERRILSSGLSGELLSWEVGPEMTWKIVHKLHNRGLFNISSFRLTAEDGSSKDLVWTTAQDRNVILWQLIENHTPKEVLGIPEMEIPWLCLPTMGGFVYTMATSPLDSSHMALGIGDGSIRLWNMAASKPDMTMLWNGIKGKVTALAWHPTVEGRLAFGTDEGRVGIFDTLHVTKPPHLSRTYHRGTVYNLVWAPLPSKEDSMFLYSCGGGRIFIHDPSALEAEAKDFNQIIKTEQKPGKNSTFPSRTDLQWKTDFSILAVGNEDGSVEVYSGRTLSLLLIIMAHKKLIQCLRWHPTFTFQSSEASKLDSWLAVASNDTSIKIFSVVTNGNEPATYNLVATLSGHKERVVSCCWDPHRDGILLSGSYDGTAQVWDVAAKKPLSNFGGHGGRVMCCEWSALEADTAITGSDDLTLRIWKTTDQVYSSPAESLATRSSKEKKKSLKPALNGAPSARPAHSTTGGVKKKIVSKLKSLFPVSASLEARGRPEGLNDCKIVAALKGITLNHSVTEDQPESSFHLPPEDFGEGLLTHLGFFCDNQSTRRMLQEEIEHHEEGSNHDLAAHLRIWQGDVESVLKEAVKKRQLNDWLVSLAPQVSLEFWREMSQLYAEQLLAEGDVRKAVSYALISGQTARAVDMFTSQQLCRESMALSRCLYPDDSPQVRESLSLWASKATLDGNLELATKCLLANGQVAEAARTLARRSDASSLKLSADLALNAGLDQLADAYLHQAAENLAIQAEKNPSPGPEVPEACNASPVPSDGQTPNETTHRDPAQDPPTSLNELVNED